MKLDVVRHNGLAARLLVRAEPLVGLRDMPDPLVILHGEKLILGLIGGAGEHEIAWRQVVGITHDRVGKNPFLILGVSV